MDIDIQIDHAEKIKEKLNALLDAKTSAIKIQLATDVYIGFDAGKRLFDLNESEKNTVVAWIQEDIMKMERELTYLIKNPPK